ncbi:MAG: DUF2249 domain-containing protein [Verrucomicrobia bacterium]|nr:DUF2249 domain-containing protein [Verrucomicrobiota bacterium]
MSQRVVPLDVREDIRMGREPFTRIMRTVDGLRSGEALLLIVPFEPYPLYSVMAREGFSHESRRTGTGTWEVLFQRVAVDRVTGQSPAPHPGPEPKVVELDARGLEPPQPMVAILEALASLPEDAELKARTDRRPVHLYAQLEERGFAGETSKQKDGSYVTRVRRR